MYKPIRLTVRDEWNNKADEISESEERCIMGSDTAYSGSSSPAIRRNILAGRILVSLMK
jgi:hypothetical protein